MRRLLAVLATVKVPNLKANHNLMLTLLLWLSAVLATVKVPNLKANHNLFSPNTEDIMLC